YCYVFDQQTKHWSLKRKEYDMKKATLCFAILGLFSVSSMAATVTWTGSGGDGLWGTAANWSGNALPAAADNIVIGDGFGVINLGGVNRSVSNTITLGRVTL